MTRHFVIPDAQCKPGVNYDHLTAAGNYIVAKQPEVIINLGDFWDFPSLSSYEKKGSKYFEGKRYKEDVDAGHEGMMALLKPLNDYNERRRRNKEKQYKPRMVFLLGNHCLSDEHEIMTRSGWKGINTISSDDLVLTMNTNRIGEWQKIQNIIKRPLEEHEKMFGVSSQGMEIAVSEKHRVFYLNSYGSILIKEAKDVPSSFDVITTLSSSLKDFNISDNELKLAAWMITDSCFSKGILTLYQRESNYRKITNLLDLLDITYKITIRDRDITEICGKVLKKRPEREVSIRFNAQTSNQLSTRLNIYKNKALPVWAFDLSKRQFDIFMDILIEADGSVFTHKDGSHRDSLVFYGKKEFCDEIQMLCIANGYRASITEYRPTHFRVNIHKSYTKMRVEGFKEIESNGGHVWCITTPNGNFITRKNGKAHLTGNCHRVQRVVSEDPRLEGVIGYHDLKLESYGWEVYDFLKPVVIDGVSYCHYYYQPNTGKPYGGNARTMLNNIGFSFTMGHVQGKDIAEKHLANGKTIRGLICGSYYSHDEAYKGYQGNSHFRGCIMKHEVKDGNYCLMELSIDYLLNNWLHV